MSVAVYPRLGELLRARNLTVAELRWLIEQRFGIEVDLGAIERLAEPRPVDKADLEVAGAAAGILGVGLSELFDVILVPAPHAEALPSILSSEQGRRLAELADRQSSEQLSEVERAELRNLLTEHGRALHEHLLAEIAERRGMTVEQARRDADAALDEATEWYRALEADPKRLRELVAKARRRVARSRA